MRLHLTQRLALNCTTCGSGLNSPPDAATDERLQEVTALIREPQFADSCEPLERCPKCGNYVLASKLKNENP